MNTFIYYLLTTIFLFTGIVKAQYTNFRIFPSSIQQIEPTIFTSPLNPNIMFCAAYTLTGGTRSEGVYITTNGGSNWYGYDIFPINPQTQGGDPGTVIDKNGTLILTHQGNIQTGMYSNSSTDLGINWNSVVTIVTGDQDKGSPNTDHVAVSPYYGRSYLAWTRFLNPFPIVLSYTTNSGTSWSSFVTINNPPSGHQSQGAAISIGLTGQVYVCWASSSTTSPFTEDFVGFGTSLNGGVSWSVTENAYDMNGIKSPSLAPWGIRLNGYPSIDIDKSGGIRNGWLYILTGEKNLAPAGTDPDIVFHRSTNGGGIWSPGVRVNQDALNNGRVQFFPVVVVDGLGGVNVVYYDNRNTSDSMEVYLSHSNDGGNNWSDYKVIDHRFYPRGATGTVGIMGDNIGMTYANGKLWPVWMDNYQNNILQVWTTSIDVSTIGVRQIGTEIPKEFKLEQNYPNPFNSNSKIKMQISKWVKVKLMIYDILGKEVVTLSDESFKPGTYEVTWDASGFPSGVYYYQMRIENEELGIDYIESKKMVLLK